jgi:putative nucleotidyltransferase-like protein
MTNASALESRVLLSCLATNRTAQQILSDITDPQLSWEKLVDVACQLGVGPLLHVRLGEFGLREKIPVVIARRIKEECFSSQARNMEAYAKLKHLLAALTGEGISVVVLKGAALAELVYRHVGLRTMKDVDLLVEQKNLDKAGGILERLGFLPNEGYREKQWYREHHHHMVPYVSSDGSITIEIHWHIIERTALMDMPIDQLWARAQSVRIASVPCLALSMEHMLLHVALHLSGPNQFLGQLRGLYDVAELLRRFGHELNWAELLRGVALANAHKCLYVVLCLVRDALGAPVPVEVVRQLRAEISLLPLEERLIKHIGLHAAFIVDVEEDSLYDWMLLDLLTNLLSCRTRSEACRDVVSKIVLRARTGLANKWGLRVKWPASRF